MTRGESRVYRMLRLAAMILFCVGAVGLRAATTNTVSLDEANAYKAAEQEFGAGLHEQSAKDFETFAAKYPQSERLADALWFGARARFELRQYDTVMTNLQASIGRAGKIADKFRFLMGEASFQRRDYPNAIAMYAQLLKDYPDSFLRANACYGEALAWSRLGNLTNTIARLWQPDSAFQKIAQTQTNDEFVVRGYLLLAETHLQQNELGKAEEALKTVAARQQAPLLSWQRQYLLARVLLAANRAGEAMGNLTNLVNAATATGDRTHQADTVLLQGQLLHAANQWTNAVQVYEQQCPTLPMPQQRQVLRQLGEWHRQLGNWPRAITNLDRLASLPPPHEAMDQTRLALGELWIQQYESRPPAGQTNAAEIAAARVQMLNQAQTNLDLLLSAHPQSPLIGRAQLLRGWCYGEAGKTVESRDAFKDAADKLPPLSTNQMAARFQYAQALFKLAKVTDYTNAVANYWMVINDYAALTNAPEFMREQSLHQIVRASDALGDAVNATNALNRLLTNYPQSTLGDRCLLLVGQILDRQGRSAEGRLRFAELLKRYPGSELAPEAKLALARSYMRDGNLEAAIVEYDAWVGQYTNHAKLAEVQYDRAGTYDRAGRETNAYAMFTEFMARYPKDPRTPWAQFWVGNFFFNQGNYRDAETNYVALYQSTNWPPGEITYQAGFAAGRAAFKRQNYNQAGEYFKQVRNTLKDATNGWPADLLAMAYFAYGDNFCYDASSVKTNAVSKFTDAISAFEKIPNTSRLAPQAWGRIADCCMQLGSENTNRYTKAIEYYTKAMDTNVADIDIRSNAQVGLGLVYEKLAADTNRPPATQAALIEQALNQYMDVVFARVLRPGEKPVAFWVECAGLDAARVYSAQGKWSEVVKLYDYLLKVLPPGATNNIGRKLDYAKKQAG